MDVSYENILTKEQSVISDKGRKIIIKNKVLESWLVFYAFSQISKVTILNTHIISLPQKPSS